MSIYRHIRFFATHLRLWIASPRHNFKWVKIHISPRKVLKNVLLQVTITIFKALVHAVYMHCRIIISEPIMRCQRAICKYSERHIVELTMLHWWFVYKTFGDNVKHCMKTIGDIVNHSLKTIGEKVQHCMHTTHWWWCKTFYENHWW